MKDVKQEVNGNNNQVIANSKIITTNKVVNRTTFTPDYNIHISEAQAKELSDLAHKVGDKTKNYGSVWSKLYAKFDISSYRALPKERFDEAKTYLLQLSGMARKDHRRNDPEQWRKDTYKSIHVRASQLGWSDKELYESINNILNHRKTYFSLKELSDTSLNTVYKHIIRLK